MIMRFNLKPFLRWAGGKQKSMHLFARYLPTDLKSTLYVEPFLGSAAMLFHVQPEHAIISDVNPHLINAYHVIKSDLDLFLFLLGKHAEKDSMEEFNETREKFNTFKETEQYDKIDDRYKIMDAEQAARFVYLIARCFNGLYRENKDGNFNVSYAKDLKGVKEIQDIENFTAISRYMRERDVSIFHSDYKGIISFVNDKANSLGKKCFFFLDPPYYPLKANGFTGYNKGKWDATEFKLLQIFTRKLNESGHEFMLCNHDVEPIREMFNDFKIAEHVVPRCVSCDARHRDPAKEVVIMNYNNASLMDYLV